MGRRCRPTLALAFFLGMGLCPTASPAGETVTYSYDARGRLVQVSRSGTVNDGVNAAYSYDRADNRTNVTVTATPAAVFTLLAGQSMWSADGRFHLEMQTDGNLVLYGPDGSLWSTATNGGSDRRMVLQSDGNLIVYDGANQVLWSSNTAGNPGAYLVLQNDGNLVIYSSTNAVLWQTGTNYVAPAFAIGDAAITEGGTLTFTVTRDKATSSAYTINYATSNATATAGSDYNAASGTLTFAPADSSKTISVATIDDSSIEGTETLNVTLSGPSGSATISRATGIGTINDNDAPPACQGVSFAVSSNGAVTEGATSAFTVTKTGTATGSCAVNFATADGTAVSGSDYNANSGTLTFASAQTSQTVSVTTIDDATVESAETFSLGLSGATNGATIGTASATATINDNDVPPACQGVSFGVSSNGVVTEGATSVFTVTKTGTATGSCAVNFATANGTAIAGSDYNANSGTLTFTTGQTSQTVSVTTIDDATVESAETFSLSLSGATNGATIGTASATATINDNDSGPCASVSYAVNDVTVVEGDPIVFTVTKAGSSGSSCSVNYATANGTATAPTYYTATSGTLTFTSTQTSKTVTVTTFDLGRLNITKTMFLNLSSPSGGATLSDSQGKGSIQAGGGGGGGCQTCLTTQSPSDEQSQAPPPPPEGDL